MTTDTPIAPITPGTFITPEGLLEHWQGHQRLTRRVLEAFPEDEVSTFAPTPPMRPFGVLTLEIIGMIEPTLRGLSTRSWETLPDLETLQRTEHSKAELLARWDKTAQALQGGFAQIPEASFYETHAAFGQWTMPGNALILYLIDNEIHHRAQGYVYLRLLGIEPPAFYER